ncbi:lactadherin-like [Patiria miniata]|uniref:F5/8 type C domain-containing protein n=1 Tax=Patiria miniata TaxID=46514 RepID=A0A914A5I1_PATMI|nr:lactadherin-like [Patiria miniata]
MEGILLPVLLTATLTVLLVGVESQQRVCYSGPPPEPDPDNPDDWMKQVMQEIRKRCPGRRQPTPAATCPSPGPLGMEDGTIPNDHITASSYQKDYFGFKARLNNFKQWATYVDKSTNSWIEVDLVQSTVVTGVITQGGSGWYVKKFKVAYKQQPSSEREHVMDGDGNIKVFIGNMDYATPVTNLFDESVVATLVRIEPTEWQTGVALRLELLGCRRE